jgi:hypothetical protein
MHDNRYIAVHWQEQNDSFLPLCPLSQTGGYFLWGYVMTWQSLRWQWSFAQFNAKSANNLVRINLFSCLMKHRFAPVCYATVMFLVGAG